MLLFYGIVLLGNDVSLLAIENRTKKADDVYDLFYRRNKIGLFLFLGRKEKENESLFILVSHFWRRGARRLSLRKNQIAKACLVHDSWHFDRAVPAQYC